MANVYQLAAKFRKELEERETRAVSQILAGYGRAWRSVERDVLTLTEAIAAAQAEGRPAIVPPVMGKVTAEQLGGYSASKEWQRARLRAIQDELARQIEATAQHAEQVIRAEQAASINAAQTHAAQLMSEAMGDAGVGAGFAQPNLAPLRSQIGFLADGTPLPNLLAQLGPQAVEDVSEALVKGMALGHHPEKVARAMQAALGGNAARARLIARTEMLRSYREATRLVYEENDDVVEGWMWHSARGTVTCAACWAMHGTIHPVSEPLGSHPNCRCSMVPRTRDWEAMGFENIRQTTAQTEPGPEGFRKLKDAQKMAVLGPGKFQAYKAGEIDLPDLVRTVDHRDWGTTRTVASLKDAKAAAERRLTKARPWDVVDDTYENVPYQGEPLNRDHIYTGHIGKGIVIHRVDPRNGLTLCGKAPTEIGRRPDDRKPVVTCHRCLKLRYD